MTWHGVLKLYFPFKRWLWRYATWSNDQPSSQTIDFPIWLLISKRMRRWWRWKQLPIQRECLCQNHDEPIQDHFLRLFDALQPHLQILNTTLPSSSATYLPPLFLLLLMSMCRVIRPMRCRTRGNRSASRMPVGGFLCLCPFFGMWCNVIWCWCCEPTLVVGKLKNLLDLDKRI